MPKTTPVRSIAMTSYATEEIVGSSSARHGRWTANSQSAAELLPLARPVD